MTGGNTLLSAQHLSVRFGGLLAVNDVSFDVHEGEVFTLIGPNGAGKTTVFNLISRIYQPTSGHITYAGPQGELRLTEQAPHTVAQLGIARTFQNIELFEHASVLANLLIGRHTRRETGLWRELLFTPGTRAAEVRAREKVEEVIDFLDLQHYRDTLVGGLPYGVRKVVELGRALATEPRLLLLDEPSQGLAPLVIRELFGRLRELNRERGTTMFIVEQNARLSLDMAHRAYILQAGEVAMSGPAADMRDDENVRRAYLGV